MPVAECVCEHSESRGRAAAVAHRLGTPTPAPPRRPVSSVSYNVVRRPNKSKTV